MLVPVGISNRHFHCTKEDFIALFGKETFVIKANVKQPKNFACEETVTIRTAKNEIKNVRLLGPFRKYTQVEISATDARTLGINPPVRESGDVENAASLEIVGPNGTITTTGCIIAQRHIHITFEDQKKLGLPDVVSVKVEGEKGGILSDVHIKASEEAYFEIHLDTDEANAFKLSNDQELKIIY